MNTLSRQLTARFFSSPSDFYALRLRWSQLINSERKHELTAVHHLAYLVLCGKDWRKAFTFPTDANKLNNGYTPELYRALRQIGSNYQEEYVLRPFAGCVSNEAIHQVRKFLAHVLASSPRCNASGAYSCDAYILPTQALVEKIEMNGEQTSQERYVYVFVRKDIPLPAQLVQTGHACLEAGGRFQLPIDQVCRLVVLAVPSKEHLFRAVEQVNCRGIQSALFYEPDNGLEFTAACTEPVREEQRDIFRKYPLWRV